MAYLSQGAHIGYYVRELSRKFRPAFIRKAFLHWYLKEGSEEIDFIEVESNLEDLGYNYVNTSAGVIYD